MYLRNRYKDGCKMCGKTAFILSCVLSGVLLVSCVEETSKHKISRKRTPVAANDPQRLAANALAVSRSFRNMAAVDFASAKQMAATSAFVEKWGTQTGGLFDNRLDSAAFFSHALTFINPTAQDRFVAGFYNIWIDGLLVVRFDWQKSTREYRIAAFTLTEGRGAEKTAGSYFPDIEQGTDVEALLRRRLELAVRTFTIASVDLLSGKDGSGGVVVKDMAIRLKDYESKMRQTLGPETPKRMTALKNTYEEVAAVLQKKPAVRRAGDRKPASDALTEPELVPVLAEPYQWRMRLSPVYAVYCGDRASVVILAAGDEPSKLAVVSVDPSSEKRKVKDSRMFDLEERRAK